MQRNKKRLTMVRQWYQLIPSRDIDDQRTLESGWSIGRPAHTQQRMVV